ncbi:secG [Symbiodinium sp. CCMP2592]|nr:secG [Symbiodinium sp. CCMP2592]
MGARQSCTKACSNCAADCTRPGQGYGDDFDDDRPGGDPAGATFEETLEDLNSLDRHLMLFCASSNLAAVRWLMQLGARWDACDANSTTCLHVACRSGTLSIVKEMMEHRQLLEAVDMAGWTPLHIAVHVGRREVVIRLLQAGAKLNQRNSKGQVPSELCADNGTYEAIRSYEIHQQQGAGQAWDFPLDAHQNEDIVGSRLQYEPFFVPRQPVIRSQQFKKEFQRIGTLIFNRQPGFGLAFLVASGVARDYPVDMSTFLRRSKVDIKQVGNFLGEAFSLSHTIRLEFLNSVVLQNTGVVSALIQVFHMLQLPDDLQKINRLVHGVARIWWRQHERMQRESSGAVAPRKPPAMENGALQLSLSQELNGLELKQYLSGSDVLHQLMFSTVMLHWYLYRDGPSGQKKDMDFDTWQRQNRGIETNGTNVPDHVQQQVYALVNKAFIPELAVASAQKKPEGGPDEGGGPGEVAPERPTAPLLAPFAAAEGWAQIVGGGFPKPSGAAGVQTVTYSHVSSIFSEVTQGTSGLVRSPLAASTTDVSKRTPTGVEAVPGTRMVKRDDFAWLSVVYTLLFFAAHPQTGAPYAFIELRKVSISQMDEGNQELTLVGVADPEDPDADFVAGGAAPSRRSRPGEPGSGSAPVGIVLLLPDGRWQEMSMPKLDLRFPSAESLKMWSNQIMAGSQGRTSRPSTGSVSALHRIQAT